MRNLAIAVIVLVLAVVVLVPALAKDFPDVPFNHWAYDAIDELSDLGLIEGYPDGTFQGDRTWTRYEFAVMLMRTVNFLEDYLDQRAAQLKTGVSASTARAIAAEEAKKAAAGVHMPDVQSFAAQMNQQATAAGAQAAREVLAGLKPGLSKADTQAMIDAAVKDLITKGTLDSLVQEFRSELQQLGADVDDLTYRVDQLETKYNALEARVTALENQPPRVTGELKWRTGTAQGPDNAPHYSKWERFSNLEVKLHLDGQIGDKASGHVTIWRPDNTYDWDQRGTHVDTAYIDVKDGLAKGLNWRLGKQYYKSGLGLVFDNDGFPAEAVKLNYNVGGLDLTALWGSTDFSGWFVGDDDTASLFVATAKYDIGKLGLVGTYAGQTDIGGRRWGVAATYPGMDIPFIGWQADISGEFAKAIYDYDGSSTGDDDEAYFVKAKFHKPGYQPGDFALEFSYSEIQDWYWPYLYGGDTYNTFVSYNGICWDWLLSDASSMGEPEGLIYTTKITKRIGGSDVMLRWVHFHPWTNGWMVLGEVASWDAYDQVNLYQLRVEHELADGVTLALNLADLDYTGMNEDFRYIGGEIDTVF